MDDMIAYVAETQPAAMSRTKFNQGWFEDGIAPPPSTRRAVVELKMVARKFNGKGSPPTDIPFIPGLAEPDEELNGDPSSWPLGLDNKPEPPFKKNVDILLADPQTGAVSVCSITGEIGLRAIGKLAKQIDWARKLRGSEDFAVVELCTSSVSTKYGTRVGQAFQIVDWISKNPSATKALQSCPPVLQVTAAAPTSDDKKPTRAQKALRNRLASEPAQDLSRELDDTIPW
jgi:hypothetical protein